MMVLFVVLIKVYMEEGYSGYPDLWLWWILITAVRPVGAEPLVLRPRF
jgi:hypothetical protein